MGRIDGVAAARELLKRGAAKRNYTPHSPHPKQSEFLALDCLEALYGGAAGGGKSDALLMAAAQYVHVPDYSALILRRTYADLSLPHAIMDRAKSWWIPQGVRWDDKNKRFTFPSGATVTFGYLDTERDRYRYQGAELQFVAFDELTQFPKAWYIYLLSRLRRAAGSVVPLRVRSASNPGGIGHDWVKQRFMGDVLDGRVFVPAGLADNPSIDREEYLKPLALLDPTLRKQLLDGVWVRDGSGLVYAHFDEARNFLSAVPVSLTNYLLGLDFGIEDENAVTVLGWRDHDPCIYVVESYRKKAIVSEMAEEVARLEATYKFVKMVGDTGGMGKAFTEEMRKRYGLPVEPAEKQNKAGYISLMNADLATGRIKVNARTCADLIAEWRELPWNEAHTKECEGFDNHASDSALYAWRACTAFYERPKEAPKTPADAHARHWDEEEMDPLERADLAEPRPWWEAQ